MLLTLVRVLPSVCALWFTVFGVGVSAAWLLGAFEVSDDSRQLVADIRLAMKRSDLSLDYVARCICVPVPKLSEQLNGKQPFTSWWRFFSPEINGTSFWHEWHAIRAERHGGVYVRGQLAALVRGVEQLVTKQE